VTANMAEVRISTTNPDPIVDGLPAQLLAAQ
jgi:hypothetical protein